MATTLTGEALTEAHRIAQLNVSTAALRDVVSLWPLLDATALDKSFAGYSRALALILGQHRVTSSSVAAAYLRAFRRAEGAPGAFDVALAAEIEHERLMTSLLVTGPVTAKQGIRSGKPLDEAMRLALVSTLGAATRLVLSGGRETITATVARDNSALGIARVSDGHPCSFCAMLVGRGPVYKSLGTAEFNPHDKCGCQPEPVYSDGPNYRWPGGARATDLADLWASSTEGLSNADARNAFRRAYERPKTA